MGFASRLYHPRPTRRTRASGTLTEQEIWTSWPTHAAGRRASRKRLIKIVLVEGFGRDWFSRWIEAGLCAGRLHAPSVVVVVVVVVAVVVVAVFVVVFAVDFSQPVPSPMDAHF